MLSATILPHPNSEQSHEPDQSEPVTEINQGRQYRRRIELKPDLNLTLKVRISIAKSWNEKAKNLSQKNANAGYILGLR